VRRGVLVAVLAVIGGAIGAGLTFAAGRFCSDGASGSFCGRNFLVRNFSSSVAIVLAASLGAVVGVVLGVAASHLFSSR
jgi:hypothetical protein